MGLLDMFDSPDIMQSLLGINLYSNNPVSGTDSPPVDMAQSAQAPMALPQPQQDWSAPQDQSSSGLASALGLNPDSAPPPPAAQDPSLATAQPSPLASMAGAAAVPSTMPTGVFPPSAPPAPSPPLATIPGPTGPTPNPAALPANATPPMGTGAPYYAPPSPPPSGPLPIAPQTSNAPPPQLSALAAQLGINPQQLLASISRAQGTPLQNAITDGLAGLGKGLSAVGQMKPGSFGAANFAAGMGGALTGGVDQHNEQIRNNLATVGPAARLYALQLQQQQLAYDQNAAQQLGGAPAPTGGVAGGVSGAGPSPSYPQRVAEAESGGNPNAQSQTSSAQGIYQFTKPTWDAVAAQNPTANLTPDGRTDPAQESRAFTLLTAENQRYLTEHGVQPSDQNLYAAHVFGAPAAVTLAKSASDDASAAAPASTLFDNGTVKANSDLFQDSNGQPVSIGGLYSALGQKIGASAAPNQGFNSPVDTLINADPTLGGMVPANYPGGPKAYLNFLSTKAADPRMSGSTLAQYQTRIKGIQDYLGKAAELPPDVKTWMIDRQPGESIADYQGRVAGTKEAATAPYQIAEAAVREGGRPVTVSPNQVVTTGAQVNPALANITNWAANKFTVPGGPGTNGGVPAVAPGQQTSGAAPQGGALPLGQSAFTPQLIHNPDGSVASSVTPATEEIQKQAAQEFDKAHQAYQAAQPVKQQLTTLENSFRTLNQAGWSNMGAGANARAEVAKAVNSVWQMAGVKDQDLPFDPNKVASWETATKETTRLGFSLARTLGAREAMQVVQGAIRANPNVENTPLGAQMVVNTIRNNAERDSDRYEYVNNYMQSHGGDVLNGEIQFNKINPPALYANRAIVQAQKDIPQEAIESLRQNPDLAPEFDKHYGASNNPFAKSGLSKMFMGNAANTP